jgi:hypothetical protein
MVTPNNKNKGGFPDMLAPQRIKQADEYGLQFAKAFHGEHVDGRTSSGFGFAHQSQSEFALYRRYAHGEQPSEIYKTKLAHLRNLSKGKANSSLLNVDWSILRVAPKLVNNLVGKLIAEETEVDVQAIDPISISESKQKKYELLAFMHSKKMLESVGQATGADLAGELNPVPQGLPEPQNELDVEAYADLFFKNRLALEMEDFIRIGFENNNLEQIKEEFATDLVEVGMGGIKVWLSEDGIPKMRRIIPEETIVSASRYPDFRDAPRFGEYIYPTVAELRIIWPGQPEKVYREVAKQCNPSEFKKLGISGDYYVDEHFYGFPYDEFKVTILDFEFQSVDTTHRVIKKKNDNMRVYEKGDEWTPRERQKYKEKFPDRKVITQEIQNWYGGMWVVGTNYIINYGLKTNMLRDATNLAVSPSNFILRKTNILMKVLKPIFDQIQVNWLKYQQHIAQSRPNGLEIEMSAFEDISLSKGGQKLSPKEALALYYETGTLVWRRKDWRGSGAQWKPVNELRSSDLSGAANHLEMIIKLIDQLRYLSGIPEVSDSTLPDPKIGKAVTEMTIMGVNDTLRKMSNGYFAVLDAAAKRMLEATQDALVHYDGSIYKDAVGLDSVEFMRLVKDVNFRQFGIRIKMSPDNTERQITQQMLAQAHQEKTIDPETYYMLITERNPHRVVRILKKKTMERQREAMQQQQSVAQMEVEKNKASSMASAQGKIAEIEAEKQAKLELLMAEAKLKETLDHVMTKNRLAVEEQLHKFKMEQLALVGNKEIEKEEVRGDQALDREIIKKPVE